MLQDERVTFSTNQSTLQGRRVDSPREGTALGVRTMHKL